MAVRVLVVDDSPFYRRQLSRLLGADPDIEVVGTAPDGRRALEAVRRLRPDLVTMDVEMPVMDGIEAVRRIMAEHPLPILMFSSLTHAGAQATLDALEAGAADFLPKNLREITSDPEVARQRLCRHVRALARDSRCGAAASPAGIRTAAAPDAPPRLVAIGASTGGPVAVHRLLQALPADFPAAVLVIQHMPGSFTGAFARRLDEDCALSVHEASEGDPLLPGMALVAPGGRQLGLARRAGEVTVRLRAPAPDELYAPCIDQTLESCAEALGAECHALILTGMGSDGSRGAGCLRARGGTVWVQVPEECVVAGMPRAALEAGHAQAVMGLADMAAALCRAEGATGRRALP